MKMGTTTKHVWYLYFIFLYLYINKKLSLPLCLFWWLKMKEKIEGKDILRINNLKWNMLSLKNNSYINFYNWSTLFILPFILLTLKLSTPLSILKEKTKYDRMIRKKKQPVSVWLWKNMDSLHNPTSSSNPYDSRCHWYFFFLQNL